MRSWAWPGAAPPGARPRGAAPTPPTRPRPRSLRGRAGCDPSGSQRLAIGANDPNEPISLIDSFLMARGMASSYGRSGRASPQQIAELIRYDEAARVAVQSAKDKPGYELNLKAQRALQALVDYTAANDLGPSSP